MLLMTFATKSFASVPGAVTRVAARGIAAVVNVTKAIIHRRDVLRLAELDERGLKDIGLVRSDVEGALATSWLNDPSTILAARSTASSSVALHRRDEGLRQSRMRDHAAPRPAAALPATETRVACSA